MKPNFFSSLYGRFLHRLYVGVEKISESSPVVGRMFAMPLGLVLFFSIPLMKILGFLEECCMVLVNVLGAFLHPRCNLVDAKDCFKDCLRFAAGLIVSPVLALFAGIAVFSAIMIDPRRSSQRFALECAGRGHVSRC